MPSYGQSRGASVPRGQVGQDPARRGGGPDPGLRGNAPTRYGPDREKINEEGGVDLAAVPAGPPDRSAKHPAT